MSALYEDLKRYCETYHMIQEGDRIIAGVSGGADSVCLFLLLCKLRKEWLFDLSVIHVEHGIRGEESKEDAAFVKKLCEEAEVPCRMRSVDAPGFAKEHRLSLEEAARGLRYRAFQEYRQELLADGKDARVLLATAHNRGDQAETVLFHLIRGSSMRGLTGIRPVQEGLIRPLLFAPRKEILACLKENGASWREDATNADPAMSRNRLRLDILPMLEELNPEAEAHIAAAAEDLAGWESYLEQETKEALLQCLTAEKPLVIKKADYERYAPLMQQRIVYEAIVLAAGSRKDIERSHVEAVMELMENQSGRQLSLPYDLNAQRIYQGVRLVRLHTGAKKETRGKTPEELQKLIRTRVFDRPENLQIPKKKYTKWLDYDKIKNGLQVRTRRSGDYLQIDDAGGEKTLKKYLIDEKVPGEERGDLPLLCDGKHVVWVIGRRVSAYYKVTDETKRIIEVLYVGGLEQ
ncbi:MAG: tRNA lysidine(34) synthetase TilS [Lachnospiraceae bacterium]|nr:tRNA lysidine(34) synthetase TilS [Lachnospiraceae bacterium]